jgi:cellobiose-specific phosphotransferase system component IIB
MGVTIEKKIMKELEAIRKDLDFIKEHMVDIDTILTSGEEKMLEEAMKELNEGKAIRLEKLERKLYGP